MNYLFYDTINRINYSIRNNKNYLFISNSKIIISLIKLLISLKLILRYRIYNRKILIIIYDNLNIKFKFISKISHKKFYSSMKLKKYNYLNGIVNTNLGLLLLSNSLYIGIGGELLCLIYNV